MRVLIAALCGLFLCVGMSGAASARDADTRNQLPTIDHLLGQTLLGGVSLSPSGRYVAMILGPDLESELIILDTETGERKSILKASFREHFGGSYMPWVGWKTDDRLVVGYERIEVDRVRNREDGRIYRYGTRRFVVAINRDGGGSLIFQGNQAAVGRGTALVDMLRNQPDYILMRGATQRRGVPIVRLNINTGDFDVLTTANGLVTKYYVDHAGDIVARERFLNMSGRLAVVEVTTPGSNRWTSVAEVRASELREGPEFTVLGATETPGELYVIRPAEGDMDTSAVYRLSLRDLSFGEPIWRHEQYDVHSIVHDRGDDALAGGCYVADVFRCDFLNADTNATMRTVEERFEGPRNIRIVARDRDDSRWVLLISGSDDAGGYWLLDRASGEFTSLHRARPWLDEMALGAMERIDYVARDGTALHGYLTRPRGAPAGQAPLVVMPHGGPESRDQIDYDPWVQFLVSQGYAVFQPNFRGSSGFGRAFAEAGYRQWGRRMQDDVTDGVAHLIATGEARSEAMCIVGASYGGYAALWGGASQPDLYRCVVSIAGVGDLNDMLRYERENGGFATDRYEYWVKSIGDPRDGAAALSAYSPIDHVTGWRPPVLLMHGDEDTIVPVRQSRNMERALRRQGVDVRLVEFKDEGHSDWLNETNDTMLTELGQFLARHLPVANDAGGQP